MALSTPHLDTVDSSLRGMYVASPVRFMIYGRGTALTSLESLLSKLHVSKALIITGNSLATKTPVIKDIERALGAAHVGTYSKVGQHTPISGIQEAVSLVKKLDANVLVSVGGGSPIDAAKAVAYNVHKDTGVWIPSIAIPTTLSVAETTQNAGFTSAEGIKIAVTDPELAPKAVVYDGDVTMYTPLSLWTSTGMRAVDHAVELLYHPLASEIPTKRLALEALHDLFTHLPESKEQDDADRRQRLLLAAYSSLFPFLFSGGAGLSHSIGHAIGAPYGIPHGITSCISLAAVVKYKARTNPAEAKQIARILPYIGKESTGDAGKDAEIVSQAIAELVAKLGHTTTLSQKRVKPGEEEAIAERALHGRDHPQFSAGMRVLIELPDGKLIA